MQNCFKTTRFKDQVDAQRLQIMYDWPKKHITHSKPKRRKLNPHHLLHLGIFYFMLIQRSIPTWIFATGYYLTIYLNNSILKMALFKKIIYNMHSEKCSWFKYQLTKPSDQCNHHNLKYQQCTQNL